MIDSENDALKCKTDYLKIVKFNYILATPDQQEFRF